jgi:signal transduction histidine kinase
MQVIDESAVERAPILAEVADFSRQATEAFFLPDVRLTGIYGVAWRWFGLDDEAVNQILASALAYVGEAAQAMDIELNQDADLLLVMEKANAALSRLSSRMEPALRQVVAGEFVQAPGRESERLREEAMVNTLEAVAHEIRNPLMSVGGFAKRLASQMESSEQARAYAQVIISEAARLDHVLSEMVKVAGPYKPAPRPMDMTKTLAGIIQDFTREPPGKAADGLPPLDWHLPQERVLVIADPEGLTAAVKSMISYGAMLLDVPQGSMHVHLGEKAGWAQITVFGPGSPQPKADALAGKHFGPELGLARARRIMEAHGGYLSAGSAPNGNGFVLTAALPQNAANA